MMLVYLDMCCLKRPFDDQSQPRNHLESEAVLALLGTSEEMVRFVRSPALALENEQNPIAHRAAKVRLWLDEERRADASDANLEDRTKELILLGFKNLDALHLASAEASHADVLCTCDDRFLATANRHSTKLRVRVVSPRLTFRRRYSHEHGSVGAG